MTSAQHAEGRQFNPGWVYFCCGQLAGWWLWPIIRISDSAQRGMVVVGVCVCVCVCVCVWLRVCEKKKRERERERPCVCVCVAIQIRWCLAAAEQQRSASPAATSQQSFYISTRRNLQYANEFAVSRPPCAEIFKAPQPSKSYDFHAQKPSKPYVSHARKPLDLHEFNKQKPSLVTRAPVKGRHTKLSPRQRTRHVCAVDIFLQKMHK